MTKWLISSGTFIFGVVPATYLVFWAAMLLLAVPFGLSMNLAPADTQMLAKLTWLILAGVSGVVGYHALLRAARGVRTPRVVHGLLLGIAANAYGIYLAWDLNSYAMRQWSTWCWFVSPMIVGLCHVGAYYIGGQRSDRRST